MAATVDQDHFQLEFYRARFPLRFCALVLLCLIALWIDDRIANWYAPVNVGALIGHAILVTVFVAVSLALLRFFNELIIQLRPVLGMCLGFGIVLLVAIGLHLARNLTDGQSAGIWSLPYLSHISADTTLLLLSLTSLFGLPLFWLEQQIFSVRAQAKVSEALQFAGLGLRIRPHFLFNTLNSVAHLISFHPARAEKALYNLADVFRVVLADKRDLVSMKAELELADKYLYLEKARLGERLRVVSQIDPDSLSVMVPVLLLQPLLENAVYHGIETRFKGGTINLSVQVADNQLVIQITNPLPEGSIKRGGGNKVAQEELRERIYQTFGDRGLFDAHEMDEKYVVTLRLPL